MDILKAIASALGLAEFWSRWFEKKENEQVGAQRNENAALVVQADHRQQDAKADERIDAMPDDQLNQLLRSDGAGNGGSERSGVGEKVPARPGV